MDKYLLINNKYKVFFDKYFLKTLLVCRIKPICTGSIKLKFSNVGDEKEKAGIVKKS
jgi:hypothetical protein